MSPKMIAASWDPLLAISLYLHDTFWSCYKVPEWHISEQLQSIISAAAWMDKPPGILTNIELGLYNIEPGLYTADN